MKTDITDIAKKVVLDNNAQVEKIFAQIIVKSIHMFLLGPFREQPPFSSQAAGLSSFSSFLRARGKSVRIDHAGFLRNCFLF